MSYLIISYVSDAVRLKQEVDMDASHDGPALQQSPAKGTSGVGSKRSATASADNSSSSGRSSPSPPPAKAACLDAQVFQCPMCSYRADKPASLNRHMRIHNRQSHAVGKQETTTAASARAGSAPGDRVRGRGQEQGPVPSPAAPPTARSATSSSPRWARTGATRTTTARSARWAEAPATR